MMDGRTGKITGISFVHVIFGYIVTLDEPMDAPPDFPGEDWTTVSIMGGLLEPLDLAESVCMLDSLD